MYSCPPSDRGPCWWLVAAFWSCLSFLLFNCGLSSPDLICCYAMSLWYVALLSGGCAPTTSLATGFRCLLSCPSLSSLLGVCKFLWVLFTSRVRNLRDGVTPAGPRLLVPRSDRRFSLFLFPFWTDSSRRGHPLGRDCFWFVS